MTQKLQLASNLLLKVSVLFVLQAIILLMISNYHTQANIENNTVTDKIKNSILETPKESTKSTAGAYSNVKPASKK